MKQRTVLIADDDPDLVQVLSTRCSQLGLNIFRSPDAMHALLGAHRVQPDLILLDINMPGGNGLSACEMIATDQQLKNTPVIVITGEPADEAMVRCRAVGAHFVEKGADFWERLQPLVCELLRLAPRPAEETRLDEPERVEEPPRPSVAGVAHLERQVRVDAHAQRVLPRGHAGDVDPLARQRADVLVETAPRAERDSGSHERLRELRRRRHADPSAVQERATPGLGREKLSVQRVVDHPRRVAAVLDHAGNHHAHGMITDEIAWSLEGRAKRPAAPSVRTCPECFAIVPPGVPTCPACGADLSAVDEAEPPGVDNPGELVEFKRDSREHRETWYRSLVNEASARGYTVGWARFRYRDRYGTWPRLRQVERDEYRCRGHVFTPKVYGWKRVERCEHCYEERVCV